MDAELKAKWVAALRSGEYQQGRSFLYRSGKYCCLGVLEICRGKDHKELEGRTFPDDDILTGPEQSKLIMMNDGDAMKGQPIRDFGVIADYIEANL